ncbi:unnamed protein product (macronuclear) [Paramecium tetraurelia]|uniref:Uncharacterized protein n=1 Tax=Paramecium tetraurelia TaxID=5888 RepID=A0DSF8_PARTE|nr:uncharacterized protein GSPATT00019679001 [Paramecium tetraurelia]CAK85975.1 unnamed protein product [Paramecium tetraurelia]|eukprot:XP_001453372.1 hypothetical protein (macronuclear) [Paramecium tetraurelia strain d4-2]
MRSTVLLFLLFIANAQDQLQKEEAIQIVKDLKDATTKSWSSQKNRGEICAFTEMVAEQDAQCQTRNGQNKFIYVSSNQSTQIIETNKQKINKNVQRRMNLQELSIFHVHDRCKSNVKNIKLKKDQKEAKTLFIQLQKSFSVFETFQIVKQWWQSTRNALQCKLV